MHRVADTETLLDSLCIATWSFEWLRGSRT
jgi:hypothetical protein